MSAFPLSPRMTSAFPLSPQLLNLGEILAHHSSKTKIMSTSSLLIRWQQLQSGTFSSLDSQVFVIGDRYRKGNYGNVCTLLDLSLDMNHARVLNDDRTEMIVATNSLLPLPSIKRNFVNLVDDDTATSSSTTSKRVKAESIVSLSPSPSPSPRPPVQKALPVAPTSSSIHALVVPPVPSSQPSQPSRPSQPLQPAQSSASSSSVVNPPRAGYAGPTPVILSDELGPVFAPRTTADSLVRAVWTVQATHDTMSSFDLQVESMVEAAFRVGSAAVQFYLKSSGGTYIIDFTKSMALSPNVMRMSQFSCETATFRWVHRTVFIDPQKVIRSQVPLILPRTSLTESGPLHWPRELVKLAYNKTFLKYCLSAQDPAYIKLATYFYATMPATATVMSIHAIINPILYSRWFQHGNILGLAEDNIRQQRPDLPHTTSHVSILWHGTRQENISSIARVGFQKSKCARSSFGKGIYTASTAAYSSQDLYATPSGTERYLLLCFVHVGRTKVVKPRMYETDPPLPEDTDGSFETLVDRSPDTNIFVSLYENSVYPAYVMRFRK